MNDAVLSFMEAENQMVVTPGQVFTFFTHSHTYNEMLVYEPFGGFVIVNNEKIFLDVPTIVLVTTASFHSTHVESAPSPYLKIAFQDSVMHRYFEQKINSPIVYRDYGENAYLCELLFKLATEPKNKDYQELVLNSILLELSEHGKKVQAVSNMHINPLVTQAIEVLNRRFCHEITLQSVAEELGVTPQHLSFLFSKQMKVTFSAYLSDLRLRYAAGLLQDKALSVTDICYLCGYRNLSHFIRSFQRKYHASPKEYRKR